MREACTIAHLGRQFVHGSYIIFLHESRQLLFHSTCYIFNVYFGTQTKFLHYLTQMYAILTFFNYLVNVMALNLSMIEKYRILHLIRSKHFDSIFCQKLPRKRSIKALN